MRTFENQVVWITGSSSGIGKEMIMEFAHHGAKVVVHNFHYPKETDELLNTLHEKGIEFLLVEGDVTSHQQVAKMVKKIDEKFGKIDILINNVGAFVKKAKIEDLEQDEWDRVIDVNLKSTYLVTKAALPLIKKGMGKIINTCSVVARTGGTPDGMAYAASKGGVEAFTRALAKELAKDRILVNAISPGLVDTTFHSTDVPLQKYQAVLNQIPLKRAGLPKDMVGAALFLASEYANYITGEIIEISGGRKVS